MRSTAPARIGNPRTFARRVGDQLATVALAFAIALVALLAATQLTA